MPQFHFQLVTPQRILLDAELDSLTCPTTLGEITVLPHHVPLVATLTSGELLARAKGREESVHVAGGFLEVRPDNQVVILADAAEHAEEIDEQRARAAQQRAQELLQKQNISDEEYALAAALLERNLSRLRFVRRRAHRKQRPITSEGVLKE